MCVCERERERERERIKINRGQRKVGRTGGSRGRMSRERKRKGENIIKLV